MIRLKLAAVQFPSLIKDRQKELQILLDQVKRIKEAWPSENNLMLDLMVLRLAKRIVNDPLTK